ncbi:MAG: serine/threonine protein kinase, partial [Gemmatimonadetes bacterium]|nr:serine/threonine protein kinase [Gemmatimonadota bacterium]
DLGLVYMVVSALALGGMMHWSPIPEDWVLNPMISWVGPVILMFAAVVPFTPWKMLLAGFLAASMDPLTMWIAIGAGHYRPQSFLDPLLMHYPNYLLLGVAVVISHVVTRLGQQVTKARELGSYQLGELLGQGGMGEVYVATHRLLVRSAAIKLIRPEMVGGEGEGAEVAMKRFRREAQVAATLRSPHTVELYDFGVTDDQTLYFFMELLDGMDLEKLVRQFGPVPADRTVHILRQVCASLSEAHARGLVHRDIKPANIHLGQLGLEHDFVKVLDFGLVKSVAGTTGEHSLATMAGLPPGTPAYMAPEMLLGEATDGRADIYALGCVAYYLLTGQLVFDAANPMQMIARHLQDEPVPPSQRTELVIPPALDQVVLRCLAKKPEQRPSSAQDLAGQLGAVRFENPWTEERATQWWRVNRPSEARRTATD